MDDNINYSYLDKYKRGEHRVIHWPLINYLTIFLIIAKKYFIYSAIIILYYFIQNYTFLSIGFLILLYLFSLLSLKYNFI
jgi:hypothetical protein